MCTLKRNRCKKVNLTPPLAIIINRHSERSEESTASGGSQKKRDAPGDGGQARRWGKKFIYVMYMLFKLRNHLGEYLQVPLIPAL